MRISKIQYFGASVIRVNDTDQSENFGNFTSYLQMAMYLYGAYASYSSYTSNNGAEDFNSWVIGFSAHSGWRLVMRKSI